MSRPPRVFISYSHDNTAHMQRVLALADRLRSDGVDASLDQYEDLPAGGWAQWMRQQIESADFILAVCTENYSRRFGALEASDQGGVQWEAAIIFQKFYEAPGLSSRFIPVVFSTADADHIPMLFLSMTYHIVDSDAGYERLYRRLTSQPEILRPSLGELKTLPPRAGDHEHTEGTTERSETLKVREPVAIEEFSQVVTWGHALIARCEEDGSRLTGLRSIGAGRWLLSVAIPTPLQEAYGTAPEVLALAVEGGVQPGDLEQARDELQSHAFDLDLDLMVVVDDRPHLRERLERMFQVEGQWVPWIRKQGTFPPLAETFRKYLPTQDVFERTDAVRGRQVIGRSEVIADLTRRLLGAQAVGIFGLRKMGKTTVVRAATDRLDPISARLSLLPTERRWTGNSPPVMRVAWLDAGRAYERTLDAVAGRLQRALERRLAAEALPLPDDLPSPSLTGLDRSLEYALRTSDTPIALVIDEYDLLFEGSGGEPAVSQIEKLFQLLRGHAQESARLALVVIGRDPTFFERPEMGGRTNPMLGWLVSRWLGPMPPAEAEILLSRLGRRVALDVGTETRGLAYSWSGGHPLLHRRFGSALLHWVYQEMPDFRELSEHIATDPFCNEAVDFFLDRRDVLTVCREIFHLLSTRYPESADLLSELCHRADAELEHAFADREVWQGPAARILRDFGLLLGTPNAPRVPQALAWYLRTIETRQRAHA